MYRFRPRISILARLLDVVLSFKRLPRLRPLIGRTYTWQRFYLFASINPAVVIGVFQKCKSFFSEPAVYF
jgi:hypothetical protein